MSAGGGALGMETLRSGEFTPTQQAALYADELSRSQGPIDLGALEEQLSQRGCHLAFRVHCLYVCEGAGVIMLLQIGDARRVGSDTCDVIVQTMMSEKHNAGHGTRAVLALVDVAARLGRGVQIQSAVSKGGMALGKRLVRAHGWTERWGSFYSPE